MVYQKFHMKTLDGELRKTFAYSKCYYKCFLKNYWLLLKRTGILLYRGNLNKAKFYTRMKKITLITRENVLLEGEEMVCITNDRNDRLYRNEKVKLLCMHSDSWLHMIYIYVTCQIRCWNFWHVHNTI